MPESSERFFIYQDGEEMGPFTREELVELRQGQVLSDNMMLRRESDGTSLPLARLFATAGAAAAGAMQPEAVQESPEPVIMQRELSHENQPHKPDGKNYPAPPQTVLDTNFKHDSITSRIGRANLFSLDSLGYSILIASLFMLRNELGRAIFPYLLLAAGLVFLVNYIFHWRTMRVVVDTPTSKARSAAVGQLEITGRALALNNLCGPYSGTPCIICEYKEEKADYRGRRRTVSSGSLAAPFLLEDETGKILVDPNMAQVDFSVEGRLNSGGWDYHCQYAPGVYVMERMIYPGEELYILGRADFVTNSQGDHHFMIHKGENEDFIIARGKENTLLKRLKRRCVISVCLGLVLLIAAIWMATNRGSGFGI